MHSEYGTTLQPRFEKCWMLRIQHEIRGEDLLWHGGGDEQTEHVFQVRQQMIGCQHERRTDFRTGQIDEGVAD
jgi:hypothetical protein